MLDFHNHVIPGVDDGAQDLAQSREALRAMSEAGVRVVVATPHLDGSLTHTPDALARRLGEIDLGFHALRNLAREEFPELRIERGVELMLDTPDPDVSDARLRLAGTRFVLLEFPMMMVPPNVAAALERLCEGGWTPIVAHPERYSGIDRQIEQVEQWRDAGARMQVNCGSIVGRYGPGARSVALEILQRGWADYMASDFHARGPVMIAEAREELERRGGSEHAKFLLDVNPLRILNDQAPWPLQTLQPAPRGWARIAALFGRS